ncbi:lipase 3 [Halyomorpha halys]|uniref:lipase 3 n=1 Tax=Halyomorpha halys TaxID=286706 RepID=UPI0006D4ED8B|nr:lipase 3 [Halyomorpha halys]
MMLPLCVAVLAFSFVPALAFTCQDDSCLSTLKIIRKYGYPAEAHNVTTADGYILTMHRIPCTNTTKPKKVVFLQHCILCSSAVFVINGPKKSLAFVLADKGYDVWMGNARGNIYSKRHTALSTTDPRYWAFSWHEMGVYDLPAEFNYIFAVTGRPKLYYIGHSMGTTMMYVLLSVRPEYNSRINLFISLSPVAYMSHIRSTVFRILYGPLAHALMKMGFNDFVPQNELITKLNRNLCQLHSSFGAICSNVLFLIAGYDSEQLNQTLLPVIFGHLPAGTSTASLVHYGQSMQTGDFRMFDYGPEGNKRIYKTNIPPRYDIEKITAPSAFFTGANDLLAVPTDVTKLVNRMPNLVMVYKVPFPAFNHMDFLFASDVMNLLYEKVLKILQQY